MGTASIAQILTPSQPSLMGALSSPISPVSHLEPITDLCHAGTLRYLWEVCGASIPESFYGMDTELILPQSPETLVLQIYLNVVGA